MAQSCLEKMVGGMKLRNAPVDYETYKINRLTGTRVMSEYLELLLMVHFYRLELTCPTIQSS